MVVGMMAVVVVYLINSSVINSDLFVQSGKIVDLFEFKQLGLLSLWLLAFTKFRPYPIVVLLLSGVCGVFL
jgi:hypothetical protein